MRVARARLRDGSTAVGVVRPSGFVPVSDDRPGAVLELLMSRADPGGGTVLALSDVRLLCPVVDPPSVRDFMIFEEHVANSRAASDSPGVPEQWYTAPAFYFTNPACLADPDADIPIPPGSRRLDFELEVAAVVGTAASGLDPDDPRTCEVIAGFALLNDWSARDLQFAESGVGLGPAKGKDFATTIGPWIVTPDELDAGSPGRFTAPLEAFVDGRRVGGGDLNGAYFSWSQVLARACENTRLRPGDVLGSGTVGTGCLLELRALGERTANPWLRAGNIVTLAGGPLGRLSNRIVEAATGGGHPPDQPGVLTATDAGI